MEMKLSEKDKVNLIDALKEWKECIGPKEMDEQDAGLDDDRYIDMMARLEGTGESTITTLFKGEYVLVDLVDETIELTVEDNVYSRSESLELLEELKMACGASRYSGICVASDEYLSHYPNHLPRLMEEIEGRAERRENRKGDEQ
tara:strand:- start:338 stop:772 length:435 start_codon:yes stop_codon:yes gene_type:complete